MDALARAHEVASCARGMPRVIEVASSWLRSRHTSRTRGSLLHKRLPQLDLYQVEATVQLPKHVLASQVVLGSDEYGIVIYL
eukprot:1156680-Pelagomonas_calceolata.AAC.4